MSIGKFFSSVFNPAQACPTIAFFRATTSAILPRKAHSDVFADAAFDLFYSGEPVCIPKGGRATLPTGIQALVPDGYWIKFHERSGLASKKGVAVLAGVIDSGYTGEWNVVILNTSSEQLFFVPGDAICQFTLEAVLQTHISELTADEFYEGSKLRKRGNSGFGSSDKK